MPVSVIVIYDWLDYVAAAGSAIAAIALVVGLILHFSNQKHSTYLQLKENIRKFLHKTSNIADKHRNTYDGLFTQLKEKHDLHVIMINMIAQYGSELYFYHNSDSVGAVEISDSDTIDERLKKRFRVYLDNNLNYDYVHPIQELELPVLLEELFPISYYLIIELLSNYHNTIRDTIRKSSWIDRIYYVDTSFDFLWITGKYYHEFLLSVAGYINEITLYYLVGKQYADILAMVLNRLTTGSKRNILKRSKKERHLNRYYIKHKVNGVNKQKLIEKHEKLHKIATGNLLLHFSIDKVIGIFPTTEIPPTLSSRKSHNS